METGFFAEFNYFIATIVGRKRNTQTHYTLNTDKVRAQPLLLTQGSYLPETCVCVCARETETKK